MKEGYLPLDNCSLAHFLMTYYPSPNHVVNVASMLHIHVDVILWVLSQPINVLQCKIPISHYPVSTASVNMWWQVNFLKCNNLQLTTSIFSHQKSKRPNCICIYLKEQENTWSTCAVECGPYGYRMQLLLILRTIVLSLQLHFSTPLLVLPVEPLLLHTAGLRWVADPAYLLVLTPVVLPCCHPCYPFHPCYEIAPLPLDCTG